MRTRQVALGAVLAVSIFMLPGCHRAAMDMSDWQAPQRPAALDALNMFVGTWEGTANVKMVGAPEVVVSKGAETLSWEADGWVLVDHMEYAMGDGEEKMRGVGFWVWDPKAEEYRMWFANSSGETSEGLATYAPDSRTWHFKACTRNSPLGKATFGEGKAVFVDDNTQQWTWTEWTRSWWFFKHKVMELEGTSHRKG
ncbi:MAG TPA: hypothetical protein PKK06_06355 [Phycisphaerae bacterium]|nr:hypothetical protein [Phycisphaerae bacterium]HNU44532.1 hypothetical protein [Phycisphaerae bacterium]